jgi:predicted metal-dependent phosphoesterase TrpH
VIDLHLHTTASDGLCTPADLVRRASIAGITVMGVTDHDTTAAVPLVAAAAKTAGLTVVPGIEVTAVHEGRDVHVLGYFLDPDSPGLSAFLSAQQADRVRRGEEIGHRLAALGCPIDLDELLAGAGTPGARVVARPQIAAALVKAGHVESVAEAFERYIGEGKPAYVQRRGAAPAEVVAIIRESGGLASLAHPGLLRRDDLIPALAAAGLDALEAYHSDHDGEMQARYLELAERYGLGVTGGSDFHGDGRRHGALGSVDLPEVHFRWLQACADARSGARRA